MLGPPDIEARIGLTGGNIFQGEVTPDQMWEGRLVAHPGDGPLPVRRGHPSRRQRHRAERANAAVAVLADAGVAIGAAA